MSADSLSECDENWYFGKISAQDAEEILTKVVDGDSKIFHGLDSLVANFSLYPVTTTNTLLKKACSGKAPPSVVRLFGSSTLLHRSTSQCNMLVVNELLKSGYQKLNDKDHKGQTAIHIACKMNNVEIARLLIHASACVNVRDEEGLTPLHHACRFNNVPLVNILIQEGGADILARSTYTGDTCLHEAAAHGSLYCIKSLLESGAPANPRNKRDETPADKAYTFGYQDVYHYLVNYRPSSQRYKFKEFFHGHILRQEAEVALSMTLENGVFLIRQSTKKMNAFILSVFYKDDTYHFEILYSEGYFYIDDGPYFDNIEVLIDHYYRFADGLPCSLTKPLTPKKEIVEIDGFPFMTEALAAMFDYLEHKHGCITKVSCRFLKDIQKRENAVASSTNKRSLFYLEEDYSSLITIPSEQILIKDLIGEGQFGCVYEGILTESLEEREIAVKVLYSNSPDIFDCFVREASNMMVLEHPHIVKLIGICNDSPISMVLELAPLGCLLDFLTEKQHEINPDLHILTWAYQVADGMSYLESLHFVHRDLAARNILLFSNVFVKITDFGLSRVLNPEQDYYKSTKGGNWPIKWYALESVCFGNFSSKSDIWSYGITLWEMYSYGDEPYGEMTGKQVIELLENRDRLPAPADCPQPVYELMLSCWHFSSEDRPSFKQIMAFFKDVAYETPAVEYINYNE